MHFSFAENLIHFGQLSAGIDSQQFGRVLHFHGGHGVAGAAEDLDNVGQIIFVRRIVGPDLNQVLPKQVGTETIDSGVDERDGELRWRGCFVLHDGANVAVFSEDDAAVAGGVRQGEW